MKLYAGLKSLELSKRFYAAEKRIIMHAAIYGPFGQSSPVKDGLFNALGKDSFEKIDVIALDLSSPIALQSQFFEFLRPGSSQSLRKKDLADSGAFLRILKSRNPEKVQIHPLRHLSYQPIIIIDDTLIFGQYAVCGKLAANGYWGTVTVDMAKLFSLAQQEHVSDEIDETESAAYRMVCECLRSMNQEIL